MSARAKLFFVILLALLAATTPVPAQDDSKARDKIVRDQQMIRMRLQRIEEMMERLGRKYDTEGSQRNADLIRRAREQLGEREIYRRLEEVEVMLRGEKLQVLEKQIELSRDLEDVFAILQDRSDLERLEDMLGSLVEGISKTTELVNEQEQLLKETQRLTHTPDELLQETLDKVERLIARQAELSRASSEAASEAAAAASLLQAMNLLEELASREDELAAATIAQLKERGGSGLIELAAAARDQEALAERFERLDDAPAPGDAGGREAAAAMLRRQLTVSEAFRKAAGNLAPEGRPEEQEIEAVTERTDGIEKALEDGDISEAAQAASEAARAMQDLEVALGRGGDGRQASEQRELQGDIDRALEKLNELERSQAVEEAKGEASSAQEAAGQAATALKEGSDAEALHRQEEAARALREAAASLRRAWSEEQGARKAASSRLASEQTSLARETREVGRDLEQAESLLAPEGDLGDEQRLAEAAGKAMDRAEGQLRREDPGSAQAPQTTASQRLEDLRQSLSQETQAAAGRQDQQLSDAEKSQEFDDLARRQKELEERTRDLMRRLRELPTERALSRLAEAADNMGSAASELGNEQGELAEQDEEQARERLKKALQEMTREEQKYQQIRQQEVLFRVQQELEALKQEQDGINQATSELDLERAGAGALRRSQRKKMRDLADREAEVRERTVNVRDKIAEDGSTIFTWVLERNRDDLDEVVDDLRQYRSDVMVQTIQKDVSARFDELIAALRNELKRRMEAPREQPGQNQDQQGEQSLIPTVAELIMIKTMEEGALRRLREFVAFNPEMGEEGPNPVQRELLRRLSHEHISITDLFEEILQRNAAEVPTGEGEGQ